MTTNSADVPAPVGDRPAHQRGLHTERGCLLHTGKGCVGAGLSDKDAKLQAHTYTICPVPADDGIPEKASNEARRVCVPEQLGGSL